MPSRSLARPAAFCAVTTLLFASAVCAAQQPAVPPVAEIPVAPMPKPKKAATPPPVQPPATTTTTVTTTTIVTPSLSAMTTEAAEGGRGVPEAMLAPSVPAASTRPSADGPPFLTARIASSP